MRIRIVTALATIVSLTAAAQPYTIRTAAGGGILNLAAPTPGGGGAGVAVDQAGNVFFVASINSSVWRLDASTGLLTRVAGTGLPGSSGDGGPANAAQIVPAGIALDAAGTLYIADTPNNRVRKVSNGIITTVAGDGQLGFSGDGGPAMAARLSAPVAVAVDSAGNLYIADQNNSRVRRVANGNISTVAGNGTPFLGGDNGLAINAGLSPSGVAVDTQGNLYISDVSNNRIRKVTNGIITTIAGSPGSGAPGNFSGDGGPATSAVLSQPRELTVDASGTIYFADTANHRIRKISNGVITTVAGSGSTGGIGGFAGDNGPATQALLSMPASVALGLDNALYIADSGNSRIRKVANGAISTVVGGNATGDNGPATATVLRQLAGVAVDSSGDLYFSDGQNRNVRKVSSGVITTVAGGGSLPDQFPAIGAQIYAPYGIALDGLGSIYISDTVSNSVRKISNGIITTVAGNGTYGYSGDGGPGTNAQLAFPSGIAVDSAGSLYIADTNNNRIRKLSNGVMTTIAGGSSPGFSGDNGPAIAAQLNFPTGLTVDAADKLYIADGHRIRKISNGIITTVAGGVSSGFSGDGGPALSAQLSSPSGIAIDTAGNLYIADVGNLRIRKVSGGNIATIAGNGTPQFTSDNGPATGGGLGFSPLNQSMVGVAVAPTGNLYFSEADRVRILVPSGTCNPSARPASLQVPATGGNLVISAETSAACPLLVASLPDWLSIASAASIGPGLVSLTLFATGTSSARSATIFTGGTFIKVDQSGGASAVSISAVTNGGTNRGGPVAPGEVVVIYGSGLGPGQFVSADPVATSVAGTQVFFNGIPAPIIYTSAKQVAAIVPYAVSAPTQLTVTDALSQSFAAALIATTAAAPGVFTANSSGSGPVAALNQDGSVNSAANPARIGSFVSLFVTGEGRTWPAGLDGKPASDPLPRPLLPVGVTIGGKNANISYAGGAPGLVAGVMQVNAMVPTGIAVGSSVPLTIQIGGVPGQPGITVAVTN